MKVAWQTYRQLASRESIEALDELCDRFRGLIGSPVKLVVVTEGRPGRLEAWVVCRLRRDITWVWLTYDCLSERSRDALRIRPSVMRDGMRDTVLADMLRAHLGWEKPQFRKRKRRGAWRDDD